MPREFVNKVKRAIRKHELQLGAFTYTADPACIESLAYAGLDFVVIDTEHVPYGLETAAGALRAADAAGITPIVRVYHNDPGMITKALDLGAYGVWVPHVETKEECERVVLSTKYVSPEYPNGMRGMCPVIRPAQFTHDPDEWDSLSRSFNEEILVGALPLESKKAIENMDEIFSVKGLDMISLSIGDITTALGYGFQFDHPNVMKVRDKACELAMKKGLACWLPLSGKDPRTLKLARHYYDKGVRVFVVGLDVRFLLDGAKEAVKIFKDLDRK